MDFQNKLLNETGIAAIAGTSFGEFGEGFLRFSCASSEESIKRAIEKLSSKINGAEIKSRDTLILPGSEFLKSLEIIVFSRILKLTKKARRVKRLSMNE